ncbi:SurA N-terminal domain-containing protein [Testudinibacter sp. TR-2022]|uniref:SurA N-terminal domain-containing protein n=1 Tax=Testudinibacter sp. TR-2022 TaxID=2585029 RepID=UPI00111A5433|nr:SurA N-terminal domain-containing protein [Testudinibacter sp. TR-2022]TNH06951.1 peptidylprolyl isomerase [Pasteurellaceae bacterium Phil11]TNH23392.1 peptidylprolyl isomerase [Testudinibacter sp. TR-2022]TNH27956.1 peptidylprolyl isomerase [Testudinibacter sp. TR-2022]
MLEKLNSGVGGVMWKVVFVLISISFVLGGVGTYLVGSHDTSAAKVNGEEISQHTFQSALQQQTRTFSDEMGSEFSLLMDSPEFQTRFRQDVLNGLVDESLIGQYLQSLGLAVSDEQIKRAIVSNPNFQKDGKFDNEQYQSFLRLNGISSDYYAQTLRASVAMQQMQYGLLGTEALSEPQLQQLIKQIFQTREVRLTAFPLADQVAKQVISDQEAEQYYNEHKSAFMVPELVKVEYIDIAKPDVEKNIKVGDVEIAQYYQDNKAQFSGKTSQHLAHIQVADQALAQDLYQQLQNGADFAALAQAHSQDKLSAVNGGDLSWSTDGAFPAAFEQTAYATDVGAVSQPVKVDGAYHLIKVLERRQGEVQPLDQVKSRIADIIRNEQTSSGFFRLEKEAAEKAFENQASLADVEQVIGKKAVQTDYFSRQDVPTALNFSNVVYNIFDTDLLQGGMNSEAINVGEQHSLIVRVLDHKAAGNKTFEEAKADIVALLKRQKAEALLLSEAKKAADSLNQGGSPQTVALPQGISLAENTQQFVYARMQDSGLREGVFSMTATEGKSVYKAVQDDNGEIYLAELIKVSDGVADSQEQQALAASYLQAKQLQTYNNLLQSLRNQAKIEINQDFLQQQN